MATPAPTPQLQPAGRTRNVPLLVGVGVSLLALLVYAVTLSPTVNFVDSGEFIAAAATAGITHPPGYPLYTLLTILAAALPLGEVAVRVNAVSALAGALAVGLFYALAYETLQHHLTLVAPAKPVSQRQGSGAAGGRKGARKGAEVAIKPSVVDEAPAEPGYSPLNVAVAAGAALVVAAGSTFWDWATQAKVYSLHYVFVAGAFWLALLYRRALRDAARPAEGKLWPPAAWPRAARFAVALAALFGLGLTNHTMTALLEPGLAVLLLWPVRPGAGVPWRLLLRYSPWIAAAFILGLLPYLYLPLRSAQGPLLNWGTPGNWGDFWRHVTLWQSRVLVGRNTGDPLAYVGRAAGMALDQWGALLGVVVFALAAAGLVRLARGNLALLTATLLTTLITLVQTFNFQNVEVAAYNVPWYMLAALWAAIGLAWLMRALASSSQARGAGGWAVIAIPAALGVAALLWNAGRTGHRNDYLTEAYLQNYLNNLAPNAVVLSNNWYLVSASYYGQYVRGLRPDVAIIDRKLLQYPFYVEYVDRQYPEVMGVVKELETPFAGQARQWVNGETIDSQQFSQLYFQMMRELVSRNLAAGRPVYLDWIDPGVEENYISQPFNTHPEGMALRVDSQPFTGPPPEPNFDWRGILTDPVPKDDLADEVLRFYPVALDRLAEFAQRNNHPDTAKRFSDQAAQVRAAIDRPAR